jgi:signal transduction histidine kinase
VKRLYVQIYLTVVASLALVVLAAGATWRLAGESGPFTQGLEMVGELAAAALPAPDAPREVQQLALSGLSQRLRADLALYDARRQLIAAAGAAQRDEGPRAGPASASWHDRRGGWRIQLPDGRTLTARSTVDPARRGTWGLPVWLIGLALIALAVGIAAHPVVRRVTRRLERLERSVEALGRGELSARVEVHGRDEVARLAASFNRAAERIEALVAAHRNLLANASHELRTPLARIRLGVELLRNRPDPAREAELTADIAELDALIDEILTASRLDAGAGLESLEDVDLLALAAEECARYDDCQLDGAAAEVRGDARLLRRMVRNLLENARRHGAPPVEVEVRPVRGGGDEVGVVVRDHGRGVPAAERERIFEPFHRLPGSSSTGTGLGLSLVRQIARRHGGDVQCVDAPGGGTCIRVTLPVAGRA